MWTFFLSERAYDLLLQRKVHIHKHLNNHPLEPVHIHGVNDTSIHLCLPKERATQVCHLGWAEPHKFADYDCEVMVYGPRNEDELQVVLMLIKESLAFARAH